MPNISSRSDNTRSEAAEFGGTADEAEAKLAAREREEATAIVELYEAMNKKQAATTAVKEAREDAKKLRSDVNDK